MDSITYALSKRAASSESDRISAKIEILSEKTDEAIEAIGEIRASSVTGVKGSEEASFRSGNVSISKADMGLGNVDNTADADKPISTATQAALGNKADSADLAAVALSGSYNDLDDKPSIPTKLSSLGDDSSHRLVTDAEKASWNAKSDSGNIPTKTSDLTNDSNFVADPAYVHTDNNYTSSEKSKLSGIAAGAEANVQADWNVTNTSSDAYIKNKPSSMPASDVPSWAKASTKPSYTKSEVGLGNVDNTSDADKPISTAVQAALSNKADSADLAAVALSGSYNDLDDKPSIPTKLSSLGDDSSHRLVTDAEKASWNAKADSGNIPTKTSDLTNDSNFVADPAYVHTDNNYTSAEKSKLSGIAAGAEANVQADWNVTNTSSDAYIKNKPSSMPASDVPSWAKASTKPSYTKSEVGLGNADNTSDADKPISTATQAALNNKADSADLAAVALSGSYNDLDDKPSIPTKLSSLGDDSSHRLVTDAEKASWNAKADSGDIPTKTSDLTNDSNFVADSAYVHTDNNYTSSEKSKLSGIAAGAEANVQADWNVTNTSSDAYIKNKPSSMPASDVYSWAKASTKPSYTKSEVGLGNVDNTSDADKPISTAVQTALGNKVDSADLAAVATSGDYNDLTNNPTALPANGGKSDSIKIVPYSGQVQDCNNLDYKDYFEAAIYQISPDVSNRPTGDASYPWSILLGLGLASANAEAQIAIGTTYDGLSYRRKDTAFHPWIKLFDTNNCTLELDTTGTSNNDGTVYHNVAKFPNGLCIQWGRHTKMPQAVNVSFKYSFSKTPSITFNAGEGYCDRSGFLWWDTGTDWGNDVCYTAVGYIS